MPPVLRKTGWFRWEADVTVGRTVYTFVGYRKNKLHKHATQFVERLKETR